VFNHSSCNLTPTSVNIISTLQTDGSFCKTYLKGLYLLQHFSLAWKFSLRTQWFKNMVAEFAIPLRIYLLPHIPSNRDPLNILTFRTLCVLIDCVIRYYLIIKITMFGWNKFLLAILIKLNRSLRNQTQGRGLDLHYGNSRDFNLGLVLLYLHYIFSIFSTKNCLWFMGIQTYFLTRLLRNFFVSLLEILLFR
jgi:hypothetical protein